MDISRPGRSGTLYWSIAVGMDWHGRKRASVIETELPVIDSTVPGDRRNCGEPGQMGADRARWLVRSSKPLWGVTSLPGGFDSHAPPPLHLDRKYQEKWRSIGSIDRPPFRDRSSGHLMPIRMECHPCRFRIGHPAFSAPLRASTVRHANRCLESRQSLSGQACPLPPSDGDPVKGAESRPCGECRESVAFS